MKRIKYSNGGSSKFSVSNIFDLETNVQGNQDFQSIENRISKRFGNTKVTASKYQDSMGQKSKGASVSYTNRKGTNFNISVNNPKYGNTFTQLRISKPL